VTIVVAEYDDTIDFHVGVGGEQILQS